MSKWTDIRDSIEQAVSGQQIDEQVKQDACRSYMT